MTELRPRHRLENQPPPLALRAAVVVLQIGAIACVLAALPYDLFDLDRHSVPKELVLHACAFLAAILCAVASRRTQAATEELLLGAYVLLALASAAFSPNHWLALRSFALIASGAAVFWSARRIGDAGLAPRLLGALGAGVALAAVTALAQAYGLVTNLASLSRAPGGTFGNRNFMAHVLAIGLPILAWNALRARRQLTHLLWCLGVSAVFAALVLSRSRAAWLAVGISCAWGVALPLLSWRRAPAGLSTVRLLSVLIFASVGVAAAVGLPNELDWRSSTPYVDSAKGIVDYRRGSGRGRLIQYRNTRAMVLAYPFLGVGPGNWPVEYPRYATRRDPSFNPSLAMPTNPWPSSDWVAVAAEQGLPGLALLLAIGVSLTVHGGRLAKLQQEGAARGLVLGATVIALGMVGALDAVIHLPAPALYFWAIAGALLPGKGTPHAARIEGGGRPWAAILVLAACGTLFVARSAGQLLAMRTVALDRRPASLELASKLDPGSYRIRMLAADAWIDRGRCDRAWPHALAASRLYPYLSAPRRLLQSCGGASRPE